MVAKILVATPLEALGQLICQTLESAAGHSAEFAGRGSAVLEICRRSVLDLVILDADLAKPANLTELAHSILSLQPGTLLLVLLAEDSSQPTPLIDLPVQAYLTKPFFIPALLDTVASALQSSSRQEHPTINNPLTFWEDPIALTEFLNRWTAGTPARGALLANDQRLLAVSTGMPSPALSDLSDLLVHFAQSATTSDLARFIHLPSIATHVMLYAVRVPPDGYPSQSGRLVLGMIFDAGVSFSSGKTQLSRLLKAFIDPFLELEPQAQPAQVDEHRLITKSLTPSPIFIDTPVPPASIEESETPIPDIPVNDNPNDPLMFDHEWEELTALLQEMPSPDPEPPASQVPSNQSDVVTAEVVTQSAFQPGWTVGQADQTSLLAVNNPSESSPLIAEVYNLAYTCVIIPRLPNHFLVGDLIELLNQAIPQICLAYGWRLDGLWVRPEFLQWTIRIPPTTAPDTFMTLIRQLTSRRIFDTFPRLGDENTSGEFWAPGYLILSGSQPPTTDQITDYLHRTRQNQGVGW